MPGSSFRMMIRRRGPSRRRIRAGSRGADAVRVDADNDCKSSHPARERRRSDRDRRAGWSPAAERRRLAGELHDEVLQSLLAARQDVQAAAGGDHEALEWAGRALDDAVRQLRRVIGEASEPRSHGGSLAEALDAYADEARRRGGPRITVDVRAGVDTPHDALLYRLAREFLLNAVKHADAGGIIVQVRRSRERTYLEVRDDGVGIDLDREVPATHIGLALARERVAHAGGTMVVLLRPDGGTVVSVTLPG